MRRAGSFLAKVSQDTGGTVTIKELAVETSSAALSLTANIHKALLRRSKRRPTSRVSRRHSSSESCSFLELGLNCLFNSRLEKHDWWGETFMHPRHPHQRG